MRVLLLLVDLPYSVVRETERYSAGEGKRLT